MGQRKRLQDLTIKDSFMFGAVMCDEDNCKEFLELALGISIESVTVSKEKSIVYHPEYKGVRLDVFAKDENRTHYNIEMQSSKKPALGKRTRYYHSQLDMEMLESGSHYSELPDAYVIFICDYDPFGMGRYRYTWDMICHEEPALELLDGSHTIIFSTCGKDVEDVPEQLVNFLRFVGTGQDIFPDGCADEYVRKLQASVEHIKTSREMEARYMLWKEMIQEEREEAKEEGRAEGRAEMYTELVSKLMEDFPEELKQRLLEAKDLNVLKAYLRKASHFTSIEEFLK